MEREGIGFAYLKPVDEDNPEVHQLLDEAETNTIDQLAEEEQPWQYQIASAVAPPELGDDPEALINQGREYAEENGAYAIAKIYSAEDLGI